MKLKSLEIKHINYYSNTPSCDQYNGSVAFFNEKGEGLNIQLREDQLAGIVEICSAGIVSAAKEAAQSIIASLTAAIQIEQQPMESDDDK